MRSGSGVPLRGPPIYLGSALRDDGCHGVGTYGLGTPPFSHAVDMMAHSAAVVLLLLTSTRLHAVRGQIFSLSPAQVGSWPEETKEVVDLLREHHDFGKRDELCGSTDPVVFYEDTGCKDETVGSIGVKKELNGLQPHPLVYPQVPLPPTPSSLTRSPAPTLPLSVGRCDGINVKDLDCFENDEASSLAILPHFPAAGVIDVCDDPDKCEDDDHTRITLKKALGPREVYCVRSFEKDYEDRHVKVELVAGGGNGLDGKVSRVSACSK